MKKQFTKNALNQIEYYNNNNNKHHIYIYNKHVWRAELKATIFFF